MDSSAELRGPRVQDLDCTLGRPCGVFLAGYGLAETNALVAISSGRCGDADAVLANETWNRSILVGLQSYSSEEMLASYYSDEFAAAEEAPAEEAEEAEEEAPAKEAEEAKEDDDDPSHLEVKPDYIDDPKIIRAARIFDVIASLDPSASEKAAAPQPQPKSEPLAKP